MYGCMDVWMDKLLLNDFGTKAIQQLGTRHQKEVRQNQHLANEHSEAFSS